MFGLGWGEIVVIGIVALIAIGPKELPTVLRSLGQSLAKIRRMAAEFQGQFQEALREAEVADLKKQAEDLTSSVTDFSSFDPMMDVQKDVERAFEMPEVATDTAKDTAKDAATDASSPAAPSSEAALDAPAPPTEAVAAVAAAPAPSAPMRTALPEVTALPEINVPMPEMPKPVTSEDFASAEPPPKEAQKQAGGGA